MSIADLTSARKAEIFFTALLALLVCALFACTPPSQGGQSSVSAATSSATSPQVAKQDADDAQIIDAIVDNFTLLAKIPRPSHHEELISAFLMDWAKEQGFSPIQDSSLNVMFEVPTTAWGNVVPELDSENLAPAGRRTGGSELTPTSAEMRIACEGNKPPGAATLASSVRSG